MLFFFNVFLMWVLCYGWWLIDNLPFQSQRLVYDNLQTMSCMQKFMMSITRGSQDTVSAARNFIKSLNCELGTFSGA